MLPCLAAGFRQLEENYEALRLSLGQVPDDMLAWSPGGDTRELSVIAQHIVRGNLVYASVIGPEDHRPQWTFDPALPRDTLLSRIDHSFTVAHATLEAVTEENLRDSRCDDWCPNCDEQVIQGPLDAEWFALQMARHTAYHLGQINLYLRMLGSKSVD